MALFLTLYFSLFWSVNYPNRVPKNPMPGVNRNEFRTESMNFEGHLCNASTKQHIQVKDTHEFDAFLKIQQQVCPRICHVYTRTCIYIIKPTWIHPILPSAHHLAAKFYTHQPTPKRGFPPKAASFLQANAMITFYGQRSLKVHGQLLRLWLWLYSRLRSTREKDGKSLAVLKLP